MKRFYAIQQHGRKQYSINDVMPRATGVGYDYIAQTAFWFKTQSQAEARLAEIVAEDRAKGDEVEVLKPSQYRG